MSTSVQPEKVHDLLARTRIEVAPATYVIVGINLQDWGRLLESPELSPSTDAPFMLMRDASEVTMMLEVSDWERIRHAIRDANVETDYR